MHRTAQYSTGRMTWKIILCLYPRFDLIRFDLLYRIHPSVKPNQPIYRINYRFNFIYQRKYIYQYMLLYVHTLRHSKMVWLDRRNVLRVKNIYDTYVHTTFDWRVSTFSLQNTWVVSLLSFCISISIYLSLIYTIFLSISVDFKQSNAMSCLLCYVMLRSVFEIK
jgi:hypothetical protein